MTPRKETEPTKEHRDEALALYQKLVGTGVARLIDADYAQIDRIAAFLARRDEARDAALLKTWREAVSKAISDLDCGYKPRGLDADTEDGLRALLSQPAAEEGRP